MNNIEIKIPVIWVVIIGLLIISGIVIFTIITVKNNQKFNIVYDYEHRILERDSIINLKTDTIKHYQSLINDNSNIIKEQKILINTLNKKIDNVKFNVEKYTHNEVFDSIQAYIEPKNDSIKFKFSGNQIKQIYTEHLELIEAKNGLIGYEDLVTSLEIGTMLRDKQIAANNELNAELKKLVDQSQKENKILNTVIDNKNQKIRKLKIATVCGTLVGMISGIILIEGVK